MIEKVANKVVFFLSLILLCACWEYIPKFVSLPVYIFPSLSDVVIAIYNNLDNVWANLLITLNESVFGFILGSFVGFVFGVIIAEYKILSKITLPYLIASNAIPVIAVAPIIILWFGYGMVSKIIVSAFLCFFPLIINTYKGLNEYRQVFYELFKLYGSSKMEFLLKYKLPNAFPYIISGLKINATYSVVGAVVAEFVGSNSGLGFGMLQAIYVLNAPRLWGYIAISCAMGLFMYFIVSIFEYFIKRSGYDKSV